MEQLAAQHRLLVSPLVFTLSWWFVVALHTLNGLLVLVAAVIYLYFGRDAIYATITRLRVPQFVLQLTGWSFLAIALLHGDALVRLVVRSVRAGRLTFQPTKLPIGRVHPVDSTGELASKLPRLLKWINPFFWWDMAARWWTQWWSGLFGVNGEHFRLAFVMREAVEIGLQTYQANQLSRSVSRASINLLAVVTVVLNCYSSLIAFYVIRNGEAVSRFVGLTADMIIDVSTAVVIPLAVVYPYLTVYDTSTGFLPPELSTDDAWYIGMTEEVRQFCVTSVVDYFASLMPHVSIYGCLKVAQRMIHRNAGSMRRLAIESSSITVVVKQPSASKLFVVSPAVVQRRRRLHVLAALAWSVAVISVHIHSQSVLHTSIRDPACILPVNAWFSTKRACVVVHIDCQRDHTKGSSDDLTKLLEPYDQSIVKGLLISHCTNLEMPPALTGFQALTKLSIYNATLVSWPLEAAITSERAPDFGSLELYRVQIATTMDGIYHAGIPSVFRRFTVAKSNLSTLPSAIGTLWQGSKFEIFSIQHTHMESLPESFSRLNVVQLELISNGIPVLDGTVPNSHNSLLKSVHLSGNPISVVPSALWNSNALTTLLVEDTNISTLPDELLSWLRSPTYHTQKRSVSFSGSPVCSATDLAPDIRDLICGSRHSDSDGSLRWDLIEQHRALTGSIGA